MITICCCDISVQERKKSCLVDISKVVVCLAEPIQYLPGESSIVCVLSRNKYHFIYISEGFRQWHEREKF